MIKKNKGRPPLKGPQYNKPIEEEEEDYDEYQESEEEEEQELNVENENNDEPISTAPIRIKNLQEQIKDRYQLAIRTEMVTIVDNESKTQLKINLQDPLLILKYLIDIQNRLDRIEKSV